MNDYMQALHRRFFKEPELKELREEIEDLRLSLKAGMSRDSREQLLKLIDLGIELRDEISLASFKAGFQLALGIVTELKPFSFDEDEEQRALYQGRKRRDLEPGPFVTSSCKQKPMEGYPPSAGLSQCDERGYRLWD